MDIFKCDIVWGSGIFSGTCMKEAGYRLIWWKLFSQRILRGCHRVGLKVPRNCTRLLGFFSGGQLEP